MPMATCRRAFWSSGKRTTACGTSISTAVSCRRRASRSRSGTATRSATGKATCSSTYPNALLWNPQGATLQEAWERLGAPDGTLAVIGGTGVYDLFLAIGFDRFHLSRAPHVRLPGGRPVFSEVGPERTPEQVLASHGLKPGPQRVFDATLGVTIVTWSR